MLICSLLKYTKNEENSDINKIIFFLFKKIIFSLYFFPTNNFHECLQKDINFVQEENHFSSNFSKILLAIFYERQISIIKNYNRSKNKSLFFFHNYIDQSKTNCLFDIKSCNNFQIMK